MKENHRINPILILMAACSNQGTPIHPNARQITLQTGLEFAEALTTGRYVDAHALLAEELQQSWTSETLKDRFRELLWGETDDVEVDGHTEYLSAWANKGPNDLGWVYVSLTFTFEGLFEQEAVSLVVADQDGEPKIRELEWGRP